MGLFKNAGGSFESVNGDTIIGNNVYFQGTLAAKGSIEINGRIDGFLADAKTVIFGKNGKIKGDISCEVCCVRGEVNGNIIALDRIEVLFGARIEGNLCAPKIIIEEGAVFNGRCCMENCNKRGMEKAVYNQHRPTTERPAI